MMKMSDQMVEVGVKMQRNWETHTAQCSFSYAAASVWNLLPANVRLCQSVETSKNTWKHSSSTSLAWHHRHLCIPWHCTNTVNTIIVNCRVAFHTV